MYMKQCRNILLGFHQSSTAYFPKPMRMVINTLRPERRFADIFNTFSWNNIVVFWLKFEFMPECPIKSQHWFIHDGLTPTMRQAITNPTDWHTHMITRLNGAPSQQKVLQTFFYMFRYMNLKPGIYIQQVAWHMRFEFHHNQVYAPGEFSGLFSKYFEVSVSKLIYTLSRLHNILSLCFTRMGFLWPSSCS